MLGGIASGKTTIRGFLESEDCRATLKAFEAMGVGTIQRPDGVIEHGAHDVV